jgi:integrase
MTVAQQGPFPNPHSGMDGRLIRLLGSEDLIFNGPKGAALRRNNFHRSARWAECVAKAGLPQGFRFHDLRHTGNTLAASSGASTRELMHRMGHASMRAALIYQHATSKRDREIAAAIDARIGRGDDS